MRHSLRPFAFLRISQDRIAWAEASESGWEKSAHPPEKPYFWAPDFFLKDPKPFLKPENFALLSPQETRARLKKILSPVNGSSEKPLFPPLQWQPASKEDFHQTFQDLRGRFERKQLEKAVPVLIDQAHPVEEKDLKEKLSRGLLKMFDLLMELPESLMPFFLVDEEWIFGATPETLVRQSQGVVHTQAVAGTTFDRRKSLLQDPKERHEHEVVIREIKKILASLGTVESSATYEKELPGLKHLVTDLRVQPERKSGAAAPLIETALRLHPTPALGGSPQKEAFTWLEHQPPGGRRRRYGAPFGFVTEHGDGHIVVAIRALQIVENKLLSIAGAGVVKESQFENEWNEIHAKMNTVLQIFGVK